MQKIIPHLWFNTEAKEAAEFYISVFPDSRIKNITTLHNTPSGDCDTLVFELWGQTFMSISGGPYFKVNPSISFMVNFDPSRDAHAKTKIDEIWSKLAEGGKVLMPIQKYPFSERYGWIEDKYGVSWQLILTNPEGEPRPTIIPSLMFTKNVNGKAEEATDFYLSIFKNSKRGTLSHYPPEAAPDKNAKVMFTDYMLEEQWFVAMDGGDKHDFIFNEALSLIVKCDTQEEIDYLWEKLSADPKAEQCGWLKDKYGVSWQITPTIMDEVMQHGTQEQIDRITQAFLPMKKLDIKKLKEVFEGK